LPEMLKYNIGLWSIGRGRGVVYMPTEPTGEAPENGSAVAADPGGAQSRFSLGIAAVRLAIRP